MQSGSGGDDGAEDGDRADGPERTAREVEDEANDRLAANQAMGHEHRDQSDQHKLRRREEEKAENEWHRFEMDGPRLAAEDEVQGHRDRDREQAPQPPAGDA